MIVPALNFSQYKVNTLLRRISRRMGLNQIADQGQYLRHLRESPAEVEALFRELLIGVTGFFRDAESFEALKTDMLPSLLARQSDDGTLLDRRRSLFSGHGAARSDRWGTQADSIAALRH
ncbi:MAG: hypothetical protein M0036_19665 [Desulfobacteraceae bacterium]|nr:hypothetical protein [Desulfobacteraceae bacterium]